MIVLNSGTRFRFAADGRSDPGTRTVPGTSQNLIGEIDMAMPHAAPGEKIDVRPLGPKITGAVTTALVKTPRLEVIRLVLPAGKGIAPHHVTGHITVQCLEGRVAFKALGETQELEAGEMIYLGENDEHSLVSIEDASVLVTILL